jgi:thioredoxin 1
MKASFQDLIGGDKPILVDFFATWCQPCKTQAPILVQLSAEIHDRIRIVKIDVDKNPQVAQQYQVQGVPTLAIFKKGALVWRNSGVHSKQQLIQALTPFL